MNNEREVDGQTAGPEIFRRKPVSLDDGSKPIQEVGEIMNTNSFNELSSFVKEFLNTIELPSEKLLPEQQNFRFIEQGGGVATVSRQLEVYKKMSKNDFSADEIAEELDCKLATSILGMSIQELYGYPVYFRLKQDLPHPWIEVLLPDLEKTIFIDYHIKNNVDILEIGRDVELGLHILDNNGRIHKKVIEKFHRMYPQKLGITADGIRTLDSNFIFEE